MTMEARAVPAGIYRHYKGQLYLVLGLARHSETGELHVVYVPLYLVPENIEADVQMSVRPLAMFLKKVKTTGGGEVPRFSHVGGRPIGTGPGGK